MRPEIVDLSSDPGKILEAEADCLWLALAPRAQASPIRGLATGYVDWSLQGLVSRYLFEEDFRQGKTTFVPTMKRLPFTYLALDCQKQIDTEGFMSNLVGLKAESVFCLFEDEEQYETFKKAITKARPGADGYPKSVTLALDPRATETKK